MLGHCHDDMQPWANWLQLSAAYWEPIKRLAAARPNSSFTLVLPPLEFAPAARARSNQQRAHQSLRRAFEPGGLFHTPQWSLVDFGALTAPLGRPRAQPTARLGHGSMSFTNWHYVCHAMRADQWKAAAHDLQVAAHIDGTCDDTANTALWEAILLAGRGTHGGLHGWLGSWLGGWLGSWLGGWLGG